jgi:dinuclear metal center YbgI/SA1388 family protein
MPSASEIAQYLDALLGAENFPDYPGALNGLQLDHAGPVRGVAAAVDVSLRVIEGVIETGANMLLVHHGMFWGEKERLVGFRYERLKRLVQNDIAVYSTHLPLDAHSSLGNNALLAAVLGLRASGSFSPYQGVPIGLTGTADIPTEELANRVRAAVSPWGGHVTVTWHPAARRTRSWGICTGAGASSEALREAVALGIDTLIVGEGPHHTAVDAPDMSVVVIYAGHYATETLGIQEIAKNVARHFGLPWSFVHIPSGL